MLPQFMGVATLLVYTALSLGLVADANFLVSLLAFMRISMKWGQALAAAFQRAFCTHSLVNMNDCIEGYCNSYVMIVMSACVVFPIPTNTVQLWHRVPELYRYQPWEQVCLAALNYILLYLQLWRKTWHCNFDANRDTLSWPSSLHQPLHGWLKVMRVFNYCTSGSTSECWGVWIWNKTWSTWSTDFYRLVGVGRDSSCLFPQVL